MLIEGIRLFAECYCSMRSRRLCQTSLKSTPTHCNLVISRTVLRDLMRVSHTEKPWSILAWSHHPPGHTHKQAWVLYSLYCIRPGAYDFPAVCVRKPSHASVAWLTSWVSTKRLVRMSIYILLNFAKLAWHSKILMYGGLWRVKRIKQWDDFAKQFC